MYYSTPVYIGIVKTVHQIMLEFQILSISSADSDIQIVIVDSPVSKSHGHIFLNLKKVVTKSFLACFLKRGHEICFEAISIKWSH